MNQDLEQKKYARISKATAILMVSSAVFYDVIELSVDWIPFLGQVLALFVDIFALLHFVLWFVLCGVNLMSPKKVARFWLPMLLELVPVPLIDFFLTTLGVVLTISITWFEDKTGVSLKKADPKRIAAKMRTSKLKN